MAVMATWEDGPEYAPLERPDAFAGPSDATPELETPPPPPVTPPAPVERPAFADPTQAVPPLATLIPAPPAQRDPSQPFDVVSSVMTAESSAWAAAHWAPPQSAPSAPPSPQPGLFGPPSPHPNPYVSHSYPPSGPQTNGGSSPIGSGQAGPPTYPAPNGRPGFPPPTGALPIHPIASGQPGPGNQPFTAPGYPADAGPFPAPGTPQWFAPGGYHQPAPPPTAPNARTVLAAATPGVLVTLAVGGLIWVLAPVTLIVAFLLSSRMTHGRKVVRTAFAAVLAFVGLVGLLSMITADGLFSQWWDTVAGWACFGSWVMILAAMIAVYRALKQGRPDPPPTPRATMR
jgi:hypothetical protein